MKRRTQRVGNLTITIEGSRHGDEIVGIGARWSAQVDGKVTVMVSTPHGLLIGTTEGVVSRLETVTGRQCAKYVAGASIEALEVAGRFVTVVTRDGRTELLARGLGIPKRPRTT